MAINLQNYAVGDYLPLGGGTMTGALDFGSQIVANGYEAFAIFLETGALVILGTEHAGFTNTGTGSNAFSGPDTVDTRSGITTGSTSRATWSNIQALGVGAAGSNMNWDKNFDIYFFATVASGDANTTAYVRLLASGGHADLTGKGVGVAIVNMTMSLETYGASRGTAGSFVMTSGTAYFVHISRRSGTITWKVDGVAQTAQSTAATIPSGNGSISFESSTGNGAGTANVNLQTGVIRILKKL